MDYGLTEQQVMIQELARKVSVEKVLPVRAELDEKEEFPYEPMKALAAADLFGIYLPEAYGGFGKSIAFLIQPVGFTPNIFFDPLPNEMIGQIVITPRDEGHCYLWKDEIPEVHQYATLVFTARTKPAIADPTRYKFIWYFEDTDTEYEQDGVDHITHVFYARTGDNQGYYKVSLGILDKYQQDKRVSGDMISVYVGPEYEE